MSVSSLTAQEQTKTTRANKTTANRRSSLLEAAAAVFIEKGYHHARVSDIVAEAGVAQGTFYLYFNDKKDCFRNITKEITDQILVMQENAEQERLKITTAEKMRDFNLNFREQVFKYLESRQHFTKLIVYSTGGEDPELDALIDKFKDSLAKGIEKSIAHGIKMGFFRSMNIEVAASAIVGMVYHLANEYLVKKTKKHVSARKLAEEIVDFEMKGLGGSINE